MTGSSENTEKDTQLLGNLMRLYYLEGMNERISIAEYEVSLVQCQAQRLLNAKYGLEQLKRMLANNRLGSILQAPFVKYQTTWCLEVIEKLQKRYFFVYTRLFFKRIEQLGSLKKLLGGWNMTSQTLCKRCNICFHLQARLIGSTDKK